MMIEVIYKDGKRDTVRPQVLDRLIAAQTIDQFKRSSGWVKLGRDEIRHAFDRRTHPPRRHGGH